MSVLSVISQEMQNDQLVVRSHIEDFNAKSQLIVHESQEAVFFQNGQACDLFGAGRHELKAENVPILRRLIGHLFGGNTPFPCEVYFVNKVNVLDLLWGTDTPIEMEDPKYSLIIGVRAHGQTGVRVKDSRRFLVNVVGKLREYTTAAVATAIKGRIVMAAKECIATTMLEKGVSILEIAPRLSEISDGVCAKVNDRLYELGIELVHFTVNSITASEGNLEELYKARAERVKQFNAAEIEAYKMEKLSEARAKARRMEGYTYQEERRFDVLEGAAKNEGSSGAFINMGVGMGVGVGVAKEVSDTTKTMYANATQGNANVGFCADCGTAIPQNAKFCPGCGKPQAPQQRFCPECGNRCPAESKFCPSCGTKLV